MSFAISNLAYDFAVAELSAPAASAAISMLPCSNVLNKSASAACFVNLLSSISLNNCLYMSNFTLISKG